MPAKSYRELGRLIGDADEDIQLAVTANASQILARFGDTEWVSQLIDGTFPDVKQIVPREFGTRVDVGRDSLLNAVRRASYFARENNDVVRLAIHAGEDDMTPGSVEVTANAAERGNSESFVDASISGGELQIAFNSRYLADVLGDEVFDVEAGGAVGYGATWRAPRASRIATIPMGYADGLSRPDTNISIYYDPDGPNGPALAELVLFGQDSNIAEDRPSPLTTPAVTEPSTLLRTVPRPREPTTSRSASACRCVKNTSSTANRAACSSSRPRSATCWSSTTVCCASRA